MASHPSGSPTAPDALLADDRFSALVTRNTDGILIVDPAGVVRFANPAAARLLNVAAEELIDQPFGFPTADDEWTELDVVPRAAHGSTPASPGRAVEMITAPTTWSGEPAQLVVLHDLTDRRRAEVADRHAQQMAERAAILEQVAIMASHDLRAPLVNLLAFLAMAHRDCVRGNSARIGELVSDSLHAAERMKRLLDDLVRFARSGGVRGESRPIDLQAVIRSVCRVLAVQIAGRNIRVQAAPNLPVIHADEIQLHQVVQNLVANAISHGRGGRGIVRISPHVAPGKVGFRVADDGPGVPEADRERVFRLFTRLADTSSPPATIPLDPAAGTGAGLAIVRNIVQAHSGQCWLENAGPADAWAEPADLHGAAVVIEFPDQPAH